MAPPLNKIHQVEADVFRYSTQFVEIQVCLLYRRYLSVENNICPSETVVANFRTIFPTLAPRKSGVSLNLFGASGDGKSGAANAGAANAGADTFMPIPSTVQPLLTASTPTVGAPIQVLDPQRNRRPAGPMGKCRSTAARKPTQNSEGECYSRGRRLRVSAAVKLLQSPRMMTEC